MIRENNIFDTVVQGGRNRTQKYLFHQTGDEQGFKIYPRVPVNSFTKARNIYTISIQNGVLHELAGVIKVNETSN